jgi:hypothetical protein
VSKRIVFVDKDSTHIIMGTDDEFPQLPVTAEHFEVRGRIVPFASLYKVTTRAAFYREPITPASYTFNEAQR